MFLDEAFFLLVIVAMITENVSLSYFYGTFVREKSFHQIIQLSIQTIFEKKKKESDKRSLVKKNHHKGVPCSPLLRTETLVIGSK